MASTLSMRIARILQVRYFSAARQTVYAPSKPSDPCDPCAPPKQVDPCAQPKPVDPCDPCTPPKQVDPCAQPKPVDPCAPPKQVDPCAQPKPVDPCDPCAPPKRVDPCAQPKPLDPCDPCAPPKRIDPCAQSPKPVDPCPPSKKSYNPFAWISKPADPCAQPKSVDPCAQPQRIDPCGPKPVDPCPPCPPSSPPVTPCPPKPPEAPKLTRLPNGLVVASIENYAPVSRIAFVANAGSRFENGDNLGVTHFLRLASGLSTQQSSSFKITRTLEQAGAEFTCSSTREYMFYKIDSLRGHLAMVTSVLNQVTTAPTFKSWELSDLTQPLRLDLARLQTQPNVLVYDLLHQAAFRDTLGRSLYAPDFKVGQFTCEELFHFVKSYYSTGRVALVGIGVDHEELLECACKFQPFCAANIANDKARYYGGEIRQDTGGDLAYAAMAFEGPGQSGQDLLQAACLQNLMGLGPTIKLSAGTASSPLAQAVAQATCQPFAITCISASYTDSGLFGFYAIAPPKEMEKVLRAAYKQFTNTINHGLEEKKVAKAKKQLKAQIAMCREGADTLLYDLGEQALGADNILTTPDLFKYVDCINTSDITAMAKKMIEGKPTMAAMGNLSQTPYVDNLQC